MIQKPREELGDYELHIAADGTIKEIPYIVAPTRLVAVMVRQNGANMLYYTCTDHLGSLTVLTDSLGNEQERYSYDAWGRQRNPEDWTEYPTTTNAGILDRAYEYTGHETLADFGLINMNGRVYDPILARMLSADNYVQSPLYSQNYNRYSYCLNNPLIYKDPSGDLFWLLPYVSFSSHGIEVGITAGVGIPGVFGATATVGYSSSGGISATAGVFAGPVNAYVGYSQSGGFIAGAGVGFGGLPAGFSSNMTSMGVNYSSNGGLSYNAFGAQFDQYGNYVGFDPSIGYSMSFYYNSKQTIDCIYDSEGTNIGNGKSVPFDNKDALGFVTKNFEKSDYKDVEHLYANGTVPSIKGVKYENGNIIVSDESGLHKTIGVTVVAKGWSRGGIKSDVYLAAKAFRTTELLYITLQHEFGHARLNSLGYFGKQYHYAQEAIMNSLSCFQASAWGLKTLSKGYMSNSDFYSSKIPNGSDINVNTVDLLDRVRNDRPKW